MQVDLLAKEIQAKASRFLCGESADIWMDIKEWKDSQTQIVEGIEQLAWMQGDTLEEEAERVLAVLMGYTVTARYGDYIERTLQQAEEILPLIPDPVLKCHLAVFCYGICYDDELMKEAERLLQELKRKGRGDEIQIVEELLEGMKENSDIT